jgi:hypothetical protein
MAEEKKNNNNQNASNAQSKTVGQGADPLSPAKQPASTPQPQPRPQQAQQSGQQQQAGASRQNAPSNKSKQPKKPAEIKLPPVTTPKPKGPSFFGYRPPKWANNFEYIRDNKGKGSAGEAKTWLLYTVDRLLKIHSV